VLIESKNQFNVPADAVAESTAFVVLQADTGIVVKICGVGTTVAVTAVRAEVPLQLFPST
jgi:hypothetical protein